MTGTHAPRSEYDRVTTLGLVVEGNAGLEKYLATLNLERGGIGAGKRHEVGAPIGVSDHDVTH